MLKMLFVTIAASFVTVAACTKLANVQCEQNQNCDLSSGGVCTTAPTGRAWCAYPDPSCSSGYSYSTQAVGDGVAGTCVDQRTDLDAGIDAVRSLDANTLDANTTSAIVAMNQPAELVLGQPDFVTGIANSGGPSARSLSVPSSIAPSENGSLWIFDTQNHRALQWTSSPQADFTPSSRVLGQADFTSIGSLPASSGSLTNFQDGMSALADKLIIADGNRNRVLIWNHAPSFNGENADLVLGQPSFESTTPGKSANSLNLPDAVWTDGTRLAIADGTNNRVLIWLTFPTVNQQPADIVLGQTSFGTSNAPDPPTAASMYWPQSVHFDGSRFYVADTNNHRILVWNSFPASSGQSADLVIGQKTSSENGPGTTIDKLRKPTGIATARDNLFVIDQANNRVLVYSPIPSTSGASATYVLGQPDFLSRDPGTSRTALRVPTHAAVQGTKLYVSDSFNNRVLRFALNLQP